MNFETSLNHLNTIFKEASKIFIKVVETYVIIAFKNMFFLSINLFRFIIYVFLMQYKDYKLH
jgi:hypothetical protein